MLNFGKYLSTFATVFLICSPIRSLLIPLCVRYTKYVPLIEKYGPRARKGVNTFFPPYFLSAARNHLRKSSVLSSTQGNLLHLLIGPRNANKVFAKNSHLHSMFFDDYDKQIKNEGKKAILLQEVSGPPILYIYNHNSHSAPPTPTTGACLFDSFVA